MKVAFIQKNPECSLGSMYIASSIKHEAESRVFIQAFEKDLYESVDKYNPDIVAFSTFTGEYKDLLAINKSIKKHKKVFSVFGGPHPTSYPDLIHHEGVDAICRGEGELAMLELIKAMKKSDDYLRIHNFYFKSDKDKIIKNELRVLNKDIDSFKFPDRSIYSYYFHFKGFKNNIIKRVISSRGCPFNCSYCYNHVLKRIYHNKGPYVRIRSVKNLIDELLFLKEEYKPTDFDFVDDIFGINSEWLEEFSIQYRNKINIQFSCLAHLNFLNEKCISFLKEAGCLLVQIGIEAGDESFRRKVLRRNYSNRDIYRITDMLHKQGIPFYTLNILLLPGETLKMALRTLRINMRCRPFASEAFIFQPFPGTDLASYAAKNNFYDKRFESIPDNLFIDSVLKNPQKKIIIRLFHLFQFTVKFKYFYPFMRILIYMPFDRLYKKVHKHYKNEMRKRYLFDLKKITQKPKFDSERHILA